MSKKIIFSESQKEFIRENYLLLSRKDIAKKLNCDDGVIGRFYQAEGLIVPKHTQKKFRVDKMIGHTNITPEEDTYIREHYLDMSFAAIGRVLGRVDSVISNRVKKLGLVIPEEVMQKRIESSRIKPGDTPKNKGKKMVDYMDADAIARSAVTRFKKGNVSHNAYESDGVITIRHNHKDRGEKPYKFIRVSLGKWKPLQHVNWEMVHGPIPKGYLLRCKSEDTLNCEPDNWELMTKKQNYELNSGSVTLNDKYVATKLASSSRKVDQELKTELLNHPELLAIKRQELLLSRAIKQTENGRSK